MGALKILFPLVSIVTAAAANAQSSGLAEPFQPTIMVTGTGTVSTPPDIARLSFTLRGEGDSAEAAARALSAARGAVTAALTRFGAPRIEASAVTVSEARDKACGGGGWLPPNQMSTGACAVIGRIATVSAAIRLTPADKAATVAGALAAAGANEVRLIGFELADPQGAEQRATAQAFADARQQAGAIAIAAGAKLGAVRHVTTGSLAVPQPLFLAGHNILDVPPPPPPAAPPPPPPVEIGLTPRAVETNVRLQVVFAIQP